MNVNDILNNCDHQSFVGQRVESDYAMEIYGKTSSYDPNLPKAVYKGVKYQILTPRHRRLKGEFTIHSIDVLKFLAVPGIADEEYYLGVALNYKGSDADVVVVPAIGMPDGPDAQDHLYKCIDQNNLAQSGTGITSSSKFRKETEAQKDGDGDGDGGGGFGFGDGDGWGFGLGFDLGVAKWLWLAATILGGNRTMNAKNKRSKQVTLAATGFAAWNTIGLFIKDAKKDE